MSEIQQIRFIITVGFHGVFVVEEDPGASPAQRDGGGAWVYEIPSAGRLKTSEVKPFREWHDTRGEYTDGSLLGFAAVGPIKPFSDRSTKIRPISSDSEGRFYYLVGSEEDLARAMHNLANLKLGGAEFKKN
jgi:hypothetical protein